VGRLGSAMRVRASLQIIPRHVGRLRLGLWLGSGPHVVNVRAIIYSLFYTAILDLEKCADITPEHLDWLYDRLVNALQISSNAAVPSY